MKLITAIALLFAALIAAPAQAQVFVFHLDGDQVVPPVSTSERGGCRAELNEGIDELALSCLHDVAAATSIQLRLGPPGVNGAVVFDLGDPASPVGATWAGMTPANIADLLAGNLYLSIFSPGSPAGAIRGQVLPRTVDTVAFQADSSQVVPPSGSLATGTCTADLDAPATGLSVSCTHDVTGATAAHLHQAPFGTNGPAVFTFGSASSPLSEVAPVDPFDVAAFAAGFLYLDVHAAGFGGGEIRGQIDDDVPAPPPAAPPLFSKAFAPDVIASGGTSTLTFTIDNSTSVFSAEDLDFTDTLPAGLSVAATPAASSTCTGGTITATPGGSTIGYNGGDVANGGTCTVRVNVTSATAGAHVNTSGDLTSTSGNSGTAADTLTVTQSMFSVPAATGSGAITGGISGGGPTCTIVSVTPTTAEEAAGGAPPGVTFPHGLLDFRLEDCTPGGDVTFSITYPAELEAGAVYWKWGPRSATPTPAWYVLPATITGSTATYTITDGGDGDDNLAADGVIDDPGGPGSATAVPAMPTIGLGLLGLALLAAAWKRLA